VEKGRENWGKRKGEEGKPGNGIANEFTVVRGNRAEGKGGGEKGGNESVSLSFYN